MDSIIYELEKVRDGTYQYLALENPLKQICPCCATELWLKSYGTSDFVFSCPICDSLYTPKALVIIDFLLWFEFDGEGLAIDRFKQMLDSPSES